MSPRAADLQNTYSKGVTVNMTPRELADLDREARIRMTSKAQIAREAIAAYVKALKAERRKEKD